MPNLIYLNLLVSLHDVSVNLSVGSVDDGDEEEKEEVYFSKHSSQSLPSRTNKEIAFVCRAAAADNWIMYLPATASAVDAFRAVMFVA